MEIYILIYLTLCATQIANILKSSTMISTSVFDVVGGNKLLYKVMAFITLFIISPIYDFVEWVINGFVPKK